MTTEFERDLAAAREAVLAARGALRATVEPLTDADLTRARRGQWTIAQVLAHVLDSDGYYRRLIAALRESPPRDPEPAAEVESVEVTRDALSSSAERILAAVDGVDEDSFYRMGGPGHQQYSILSVLENVALHDHEHAAQIEQVIATAADRAVGH